MKTSMIIAGNACEVKFAVLGWWILYGGDNQVISRKLVASCTRQWDYVRHATVSYPYLHGNMVCMWIVMVLLG